MDEQILRREEQAVFSLRELYGTYGYTPYKMSKFEELEYYIRNKDFLISDRIITFTDTNGKLLALKPDVTLSIIRNGEDIPGHKQKVCYNENIYRISESTGQYREIMQAGLECIGDIDLYDVYEVLSLAAGSLAQISEEFVLQISHMGILSGLLDGVCPDPAFRTQALACIARKNAHDLRRLCSTFDVAPGRAEDLCRITEVCGERQQVLQALRSICGTVAREALAELEVLSGLLDRLPHSERIIFDFSVVNNMNYYSGIVFTGFLAGISDGVLSGGQYDKLMRKLGRTSGAIGFAVYLNLLEQLPTVRREYDVDVLLLYGADTDFMALTERTESIVKSGRTVRVQKTIPKRLRWRELVQM